MHAVCAALESRRRCGVIYPCRSVSRHVKRAGSRLVSFGRDQETVSPLTAAFTGAPLAASIVRPGPAAWLVQHRQRALLVAGVRALLPPSPIYVFIY